MTLSRRTLIALSGAAAASAAGVAAIPPAAAHAGAPASRTLTDAVLAAFRTHRLVAIGEVHGQQEHHDVMHALLTDPRLPDLVDDIVVEFGNALYQPVVDRFVAGGTVEDADLRPVWRNTTQSPGNTWDTPVYEQFYRMVRGANLRCPAGKRMRVLLGDPPIDWSRVTTLADVMAFQARDEHCAAVIRRQSIDRGRRTLVFYGTNHVKHGGGGCVAQVEAATGIRAYVILAGAHQRLYSTPRPAVIPAAGSWLADIDSSLFYYLPGECGVPFGWLADALLYLGPPQELTESQPNPAIFLDEAYWDELQRRNTIRGGTVDLPTYRQQHTVDWPVRDPEGCS
jgi:hypothetical protein